MPRRFPLPPRLRWLASGLCVGLPFVGCASDTAVLNDPTPPAAQTAAPAPPPAVTRGAGPGEMLPAPHGAPAEAPRPVPVSLDAVLRMAGERNLQIELAREKVRGACAEKNVADLGWLPSVYVGPSYWRHEGGIQDFRGPLIHSSTGALFSGGEMYAPINLQDYAFRRITAESKVWQQKGELSRIASDTVLEAATTYIDLLTARTIEAIAARVHKHMEDVLERARKLAEAEPGSKFQYEALRAEVEGHRQSMAKARQQGDAAAAKLAYLLGLDPCVQLVPVDDRLVPFDLIDATPPTCDLVARATQNGPGVRELEGLLNLLQNGLEKSRGLMAYLPVIETRMLEGGFGAGPGDSLAWDNRWDMNLQARWNLTAFATARDQQRAAQSRVQQVALTYQDLKAKLAAGVQEARGAILSGRDQIQFVAQQVTHASKAYQLTDQRLKEAVQGATAADVMQALRGLEGSHVAYLTAVNAYDKAQLRLLMLMGAAACPEPAPGPPPPSPVGLRPGEGLPPLQNGNGKRQ
ncbi:MAG TPA: TolC family protein [Gemmataceae bacterium]|nr:TolC family protein [Gemmataceae bacterium]